MFQEAIIIAGGKGTRLSAVLSDRPKPMAPIHNKPFLSYLLDYLRGYEVKKVVLAVGYMHEKVQRYYGKDYGGMKVAFSIEDQPLGTGGAIKKALSQCNGESVLVMNGDSFFGVNLQLFYDQFKDSQAIAQLALKKMEDISRYGSVTLGANDLIKSFNEKGETGLGLINGGVYALDRNKVLPFLTKESFSFEYDFLGLQVGHQAITGITFDSAFIDIGTPESYQEAIKMFSPS
jgi:D-glycero-alpha-D-manno-heptose 1-phosphate guanylyltransferase